MVANMLANKSIETSQKFAILIFNDVAIYAHSMTMKSYGC